MKDNIIKECEEILFDNVVVTELNLSTIKNAASKASIKLKLQNKIFNSAAFREQLREFDKRIHSQNFIGEIMKMITGRESLQQVAKKVLGDIPQYLKVKEYYVQALKKYSNAPTPENRQALSYYRAIVKRMESKAAVAIRNTAELKILGKQSDIVNKPGINKFVPSKIKDALKVMGKGMNNPRRLFKKDIPNFAKNLKYDDKTVPGDIEKYQKHIKKII